MQKITEENKHIVTDLIAELTVVLHEKAILETKNADLKLEFQELKHKFINYEKTTSDERNYLLHKVQQTTKENEIALAEKDVKYLEEQKKYLKEISELKSTCNKHRDLFGKKQEALLKEIELLKSKICEANNTCMIQSKMAFAYNNKYITYKAKLKHAITIISTIIHGTVTGRLPTCKQKPLMVTKECQTEKRVYEGCDSLTSLHTKRIAAKYENTILRELFFKPQPSDHEIQTIFFIPQESNDNFRKVVYK